MKTSTLKLCSGCQKSFPAVPKYWYKTKSTKDGLHTKCKEYNKRYYKENAEKIKQNVKEKK